MTTPADELPDFASLTYDEQRAFLGLPDVRTEMAIVRLGLAWKQIGRTFETMCEIIGVTAESMRAAFGPFAEDAARTLTGAESEPTQSDFAKVQ